MIKVQHFRYDNELKKESPENLRNSFTNMVGNVSWNGQFWNLPFDELLLTVLASKQVHHQLALNFKKRSISQGYAPHVENQFYTKDFKGSKEEMKFYNFFALDDLQKFVYDYFCFGNGYLLLLKNSAKRVIGIKHLNARMIRIVHETENIYGWLYQGKIIQKFNRDDVIHLLSYHPSNSLYGVPDWYAAIYPINVNLAAHRNRFNFYNNGMHSNGIITTTYNFSDEVIQNSPNAQENGKTEFQLFEENIKKAVGDGQGGTTIVNVPAQSSDDEKDANKVLKYDKLSEDFSKDDYRGTINATGMDIFTAHHIPPELACAVIGQRYPSNLQDLASLYYYSTVAPAHLDLRVAINRHLESRNWIDFHEYNLPEFDNTPANKGNDLSDNNETEN